MTADFTPHRNEDEYFLKQDAELIKDMRARLDAERAAAQRRTHYMKCPKCGADLSETPLGEVRVDVCGECRGIWLDAGELDLVRKVQDGAIGTFIRDLLAGLRRT